MIDYPSWICMACGIRYGNRQPGVSSWHIGQCGICKKQGPVTEPRDFGHLKQDWKKDAEK